jgi:hypothetical protein
MANSGDYRVTPSGTYRYWLFEPDIGILFFRSVADREASWQETLALYRDEGEWPDEVEDICAGEVTLIATAIEPIERPLVLDLDEDVCDDEGQVWPAGSMSHCEYALRPLPPLPAPGEEEPAP